MDQWEVAQAPRSNMEDVRQETIVETSPAHSRQEVSSGKESSIGALEGTADLKKTEGTSVTDVSLDDGNASASVEYEGVPASNQDGHLPLDSNLVAKDSDLVAKGTEVVLDEDQMTGHIPESEQISLSQKHSTDLKRGTLSRDANVVATDLSSMQPVVEGSGTSVSNTHSGNESTQSSQQTAATMEGSLEDTAHSEHTDLNADNKPGANGKSELDAEIHSFVLSESNEVTHLSGEDEVDGEKVVHLDENKTENKREGDIENYQNESHPESALTDETEGHVTRIGLGDTSVQSMTQLDNNEIDHDEASSFSSSGQVNTVYDDTINEETRGWKLGGSFTPQGSRRIEESGEASVALTDNAVAAELAIAMRKIGKDDNMNMTDDSNLEIATDDASEERTLDILKVESLAERTTSHPAEEVVSSGAVGNPVASSSTMGPKDGGAGDDFRRTDTSGFKLDVTGFGIEASEQETSTDSAFVEYKNPIFKDHSPMDPEQNDPHGSNSGQSARIPEVTKGASSDSSGGQGPSLEVEDETAKDSKLEETVSSEATLMEDHKITGEDEQRVEESMSTDELVSGGSSSQNLDIVKEDDLEVAEADSDTPFPDATSGITQVSLETVESRDDPREEEGGAASTQIEGTASSRNGVGEIGAGRRKKTKSRIVDISE